MLTENIIPHNHVSGRLPCVIGMVDGFSDDQDGPGHRALRQHQRRRGRARFRPVDVVQGADPPRDPARRQAVPAAPARRRADRLRQRPARPRQPHPSSGQGCARHARDPGRGRSGRDHDRAGQTWLLGPLAEAIAAVVRKRPSMRIVVSTDPVDRMLDELRAGRLDFVLSAWIEGFQAPELEWLPMITDDLGSWLDAAIRSSRRRRARSMSCSPTAGCADARQPDLPAPRCGLQKRGPPAPRAGHRDAIGKPYGSTSCGARIC